jgi:hypothetical protein
MTARREFPSVAASRHPMKSDGWVFGYADFVYLQAAASSRSPALRTTTAGFTQLRFSWSCRAAMGYTMFLSLHLLPKLQERFESPGFAPFG